ncbi:MULTISPECIES: DUF167 domain-containing protein [Methanothermobacter]|uniref:UPF0235 protein MTBMA_c10190 n=1 Tax=Methanothermobacter marburgensis (strain ATCC BAA-927 / DSM 2133 / JCM 14651 / NBRC 100331 / OCM 82 / Marburg) TaxID=79929 RepID=D9PWL6_METTM|nr:MULTISPECIES: DUF167 domain-containing protein [Methanothermobacter]ADL58614.1 conserved hypothetical protein [Methanothermobacter marburgensis str. Marburg]QHN08192.1 YggU family protein [Methanothermobacter sp. THM-2]WBF09200.1 YggU family protein [Methanothermobacter marburgensis]
MSCLREAGDDLLVDIEVSPASGGFEVRSYNEWRKRIEIKVRAPPEKGKANREIIEEFSAAFNTNADIVSGHKSRHKTLKIYGMDAETFRTLLEEKFGVIIPG